ncbi:hypothetical protein [Paraliomyxa miuraensis]|uniref:hypothetical protein n=1 Tax=Paraliomyxa miuraensis TaxID=376150 RepID=UPI00225888BC|nr:hypothetical protein [Paraliomyxa miuraensis]MCX4239543.1 hypothetical protein [Paraliomyxa miuraensis]
MIHERKILVQRPQCRIARCSCGVYHVSTGSVTLRMERPQLEDLFQALSEILVPEDEPASDEPAIH